MKPGAVHSAAYIAHELCTPLATRRALLVANPDANAASWREIGVEMLAARKQEERLVAGYLPLAHS